ncbi:hypothetical protein CCR75_008099 [Bremia lactucae]|uniref:WRKY19-like zinc finger domain-containing protein n=1 Tax=Bremia lactucae TaxID=4779 RepID=A0A976FKT0_BRELC|nr:hypothetical protein CCR75_008099 [Bremia lactucae]
MNSRPWIRTLPTTSEFEHSLILRQPSDIQHYFLKNCSQPTQLLPSIGSISPANTTTPSRFPLAPSTLLNPVKLEYCNFEGCANFSKMQGYCHDHIHGQPAPFFPSPVESPFVQTTNMPLLSLVLPSPESQSPYLPTLKSVVNTGNNECQSAPNSTYQYGSSIQPDSPMYTTALTYNKRSSFYTRHTPLLTASQNEKLRVLASPTSSVGSIGRSKIVTQCRRAGCENDARRKGLCMEHGGRHFCKKDGCHKCAHRGGFCISHGGGRRCAVAKCTKSAQSGGICYSHGGGKRCATEGCTHAARSGGFCIKHGKVQQAIHQHPGQS